MKTMTFTLDQAAVRVLTRPVARLEVSERTVVQEALRLYGEHLGRLTDAERAARLAAFDRLVPAIPPRPRREVLRELEELRAARGSLGARTPRG
jgi:hypothetical protein